MTAKFAGSGSLDDRRRRRLAQESSDSVIATSAPLKRTRKSPPTIQEAEVALGPLKSDVVADESLIPASIWKVLGISGVAFAAWGLLIWLNISGRVSPAFRSILDPQSGTGFHSVSVFSLFMTAQLSLIIFWYRSRSRKDFNGRYRIWGWAGAFWSIVCITTAIRLHEPVIEIFTARWLSPAWRPEVICWFIPYATGTLALHQLLDQDMRLSKVSRNLWRTTLAFCLFAAALTLGLDRFFAVEFRSLIYASAVTSWQLLLMTTMLVHARFVVHVTNEAAPRRQSLARRLKKAFLCRTEGIRSILGTWSANRATSRAEKKTQKLAAREQKQAELQKRREDQKKAKDEKNAAAAAKRVQQAAERQAKLEADKQQRAAATAVREKQAAERRAQIEADKQQRADVAAEKRAAKEKATSKIQATPDVNVADAKTPHIDPASSSKASHGRKTRALGTNGRIDPPQPLQGAHAPSRQYSETDIDDEDDEDSDVLSRRERKKLRKKNRQRS